MSGLTSPQNYPYPLYTEAVNVPSQLQALASAIDSSLVSVQSTLLAALSRKACRATSFSAQSIPNLTLTSLAYTLEDYDTDNIFNIGTSTTNFVIQTAGIYLMVGTVRFSTNATGDRQVLVAKNGVPITQGQETIGVTGVQTQITVSEIDKCAVSDVLTLRVSQTSGGALNTESAKFAVVRLSG